MKIKITVSNASGCKVAHTHDVKDDGDTEKAVKIAIDDFRNQCGSIIGITLKVEH